MLRIKWHNLQATQITYIFLLAVVAMPINHAYNILYIIVHVFSTEQLYAQAVLYAIMQMQGTRHTVYVLLEL